MARVAGGNTTARAVNWSLPASNRERHSSRRVPRLRLDHCDKRLATGSHAFHPHTRLARAHDNEAELFRLFLQAKKLPVRGPSWRLQCCRDLLESVRRQDLPAATDSTSRTGAESFREAAADYAESIQPLGAALRRESPRSHRGLHRRVRSVDP